MLNKSDLLYPNALDTLSDYEKRVVEGAHNAGHGPRRMNTEHYSAGALQQVVIPSAIKAAEWGEPGGDSDISDGVGDLGETNYFRYLK